MSTINGILPQAAATEPSQRAALGELGTQDFLRLLVTQLTQQDPLEPTDNAALLEQISSIRNIELSTTLTDSLRSLAGQQHFASASALLGQYVTGIEEATGTPLAGVVIGIRVGANGQAALQLANGSMMPISAVQTIEPPLAAAERLIGRLVMGLDRTSNPGSGSIEGVVTAVRLDDSANVVLELDSGRALRFRDVLEVEDAIV